MTVGAKHSFVGRGPELAALVAGLEDAFAGRGRLFLISGEPGIGKSLLAEELADVARDRGAAVLVGRCWEAGGAPPFWPWVQVLRKLAAETAGDALVAAMEGNASDIARVVPDYASFVSVSDDNFVASQPRSDCPSPASHIGVNCPTFTPAFLISSERLAPQFAPPGRASSLN